MSLVCSNPACGRFFDRAIKEYDHQVRQGTTQFFCCHACGTTVSNEIKPRRQPDPMRIRAYASNLRDHLTPFRWFVARARARAAIKGETDLTPSYLSELWERQRGICPLTGWQLILPDSTGGWRAGPNPRNASIDRIDNAVGYLKGNVRFTSVMANMARGQFCDEELLDLGRALVEPNQCMTQVSFWPWEQSA